MYAYSTSSLGCFEPDGWRRAFRQSPIRNLEVVFSQFPPGSGAAAALAAMARDGVVTPVSAHLPFDRDISALDDAARKCAVHELAGILQDSDPVLIPRELTLHPSREPNDPAERRRRLEQIRRSLDELLPVAAKTRSRLNLELLSRSCMGNSPEELLELVRGYDDSTVGINVDVNHAMSRYREIPEMIRELGARVHALHLSDYDGVDERHWGIGLGIIDWPRVMRAIDDLPDVPVLILEIANPAVACPWQHDVPDARFALREAERNFARLRDRL